MRLFYDRDQDIIKLFKKKQSKSIFTKNLVSLFFVKTLDIPKTPVKLFSTNLVSNKVSQGRKKHKSGKQGNVHKQVIFWQKWTEGVNQEIDLHYKVNSRNHNFQNF